MDGKLVGPASGGEMNGWPPRVWRHVKETEKVQPGLLFVPKAKTPTKMSSF